MRVSHVDRLFALSLESTSGEPGGVQVLQVGYGEANRPRVETPRAKPTASTSWTAPVNRRSFTARSIKSNLAVSFLSERIENFGGFHAVLLLLFYYFCTFIFLNFII